MPNCGEPSSSPNASSSSSCTKQQTNKPIGGYKEVVVIGNGPSGLCLSYFLSGHWPYWNKNPVSDEYLQMRLEYCDNGLSIVEQDLEYLADGLEGRSVNPVALLYDKLKHPDGDLGLDLPTCLSWRYDPLKEIDHICIGKAPGPGGAWNDIDGTQLTISPSRWMELPDMSYADWKRQSRTLSNKNAGLVFSAKTPHFSEDNSLLNANTINLKNAANNANYSNGSSMMPPQLMAAAANASMRRSLSQAHLLTPEESRVTMHDVKNYYQDYARQKNLDKYLLNNATVTAVRRVYCCSKLVMGMSSQQQQQASNGSCECPPSNDLQQQQQQQQPQMLCWEVSGLIDNRPDRKKASSLTHKGDLMEFRFWCRHLVLANGASDLHNELNVKGERSRFILRSIRELEDKIRDDLPRLQKDPLLIVGSGLSAADAILLAQKYRIRIIHVIRKSVHDPELIFNKLPQKIYPEYHRVYDQMKRNRYTNVVGEGAIEIETEDGGGSLLYVLYDEHQVKQFTSKRTCVLSRRNQSTRPGQPIMRSSSRTGGNGLVLGTSGTSPSTALLSSSLTSLSSSANSHMRHLHLQMSHHLSHKRQLGDCDEEDATCEQQQQQQQHHNRLGGINSSSTCSLTSNINIANTNYNNNNNNNNNNNYEEIELKISYACVLIGYSPDLQFLPPTVVNDLALDACKPLDTKENPIWIDQFTHETVKCKNLFAMGPLIGDNFVRFGTGGALAITTAIWKQSGRRIQQLQQQLLEKERRMIRATLAAIEDNKKSQPTTTTSTSTTDSSTANTVTCSSSSSSTSTSPHASPPTQQSSPANHLITCFPSD